jgi:hypothetical protein
MMSQFDREGLDVEFIEGVDARKENPTLTTDIYIGDWGNLMSHRKVWKDMVKNDHEMALVFEDQAKLCENFKTKLDEIQLPEKWDVIYLGYITPIPGKRQTRHLVEGKALGTWSTIVSLDFAKKLLMLDPYDFYITPDVTISFLPLKTFYVKEKLACRDSVPTIGGVNFITRGSIKPLFMCHVLQWLPLLEIAFILLVALLAYRLIM